jgi:hypothetical protein
VSRPTLDRPTPCLIAIHGYCAIAARTHAHYEDSVGNPLSGCRISAGCHHDGPSGTHGADAHGTNGAYAHGTHGAWRNVNDGSNRACGTGHGPFSGCNDDDDELAAVRQQLLGS